MKTHTRLLLSAAFAPAAIVAGDSVSAGIIFADSFESPIVTGQTTTVPDGWVDSAQGFGSGNSGTANEDLGTFSTSFGSQAAVVHFFDNAGLTTQQGTIGALQADVEYTISFNVARGSDTPDTSTYELEFVAFDEVADEDRDDVRESSFLLSSTKTLLAQASGEVSSTDMSQTVSFTYTADSVDDAALIGQDLAIVIHSKESTNVFYDNVKVSVVPEPGSLALLGLGSLLTASRRRRG